MPLSTFLKDYLYIPLGGNRHGTLRRYLNLLLTMLIGGLWHGAAWTFVIWGGLHRLYLVINHGWRHLRQGTRIGAIERLAGGALTFIAVVIAWVFFRATSFHSATAMLAGMLGANGISVPAELGTFMLAWSWILVLLPVVFLFPNSQEFVERTFTTGAYLHLRSSAGTAWKAPAFIWVIVLGMLAALAFMHLSQPEEFLYFNF